MKLFGEHYKITRPSSKKEVGRLAGRKSECDGTICHSQGRIRIYRHLNVHNTLHTYLHELLHAVCYAECLWDLTKNEKVIDKLAEGLTAWVEENGIRVKIE